MKLLPDKESIKGFAKYLLLGAAVFAFGLVWNFPYERIRETLTKTLTRNTGYQFEMERLSPALPVGFLAENAHISGPAIAGKPVNVEFNVLRVTVSPFSLLLYPIRKSLSLSFRADQDKTTWKGAFSYGAKESTLSLGTNELKWNQSISLADINPQAEQFFPGQKIDLGLRLAFSFDLGGPTDALMRGDLTGATGKANLTASKVTLSAPMVKELNWEKIAIKSEMQKSKIDIKSIQLSGPDVTGTASGSIRLEPFFPRSQVQLDAKLTVAEKSEGLRSLITNFGSAAGITMTPEGVLALKVTGTLSPNTLAVRSY